MTLFWWFNMWGPIWFLTYAVVVLGSSLILLVRVRTIWPALWRTLLVTGVSAGIVYAAAHVTAQIAAAGPTSMNGNPPPGSPLYPLTSFLVTCMDILIIAYWSTRRGRESRHSD